MPAHIYSVHRLKGWSPLTPPPTHPESTVLSWASLAQASRLPTQSGKDLRPTSASLRTSSCTETTFLSALGSLHTLPHLPSSTPPASVRGAVESYLWPSPPHHDSSRWVQGHCFKPTHPRLANDDLLSPRRTADPLSRSNKTQAGDALHSPRVPMASPSLGIRTPEQRRQAEPVVRKYQGLIGFLFFAKLPNPWDCELSAGTSQSPAAGSHTS